MNLLLTSALLLLAQASDPRIELIELQDAGQPRRALHRAEELLRDEPDWSATVGLDYLRGHLLDQIGQSPQAAQAFAQALRSTPVLQAPTFLRIAEIQMRMNHPEVAAGVLGVLLRSAAPTPLKGAASSLLVESLRQGGDCGVLTRIDLPSLPEAIERRLVIARLDCFNPQRAALFEPQLWDLLRDGDGDLAAEAAARHLVPKAAELDRERRLLLGRTLHQHRDFELAARVLDPIVSALPDRIESSEDFDVYYLLARAWFWDDSLPQAVAGYTDLAERTARSESKALALFQASRSLELLGRWSEAALGYRRAFLADTDNDLAGSALIGAMRIEWRTGREDAIEDLLEVLESNRRWRTELSRAMLFLASSDIVRGRSDRAAAWLSKAEATGQDKVDALYWRGRLAQLQGQPEEAVSRYLAAVRADAYHPLGQAAEARLRSDALGSIAVARLAPLATSSRSSDLALAWRLLGNDRSEGREARDRLEQHLRSNRTAARFLSIAAAPVASWPLWTAANDDADRMLLGLGRWREGNRAALASFPVSDPDLAFTAARRLHSDGAHDRSLYIAEILAKRVPADLPPALLPVPLRELLYPMPYREAILAASARLGVDVHLLVAILREESRFDPRAESPASARGLGQFIYPTAVELAPDIGVRTLEPEDLENPQISIRLAAAYLRRLQTEFAGSLPSMVAAYNAGERQTRLWRSYCFSHEPEELLTKVSFSETRNYLDKVLRSRAQYREIWPVSGSAKPATVD